jgi:fructose-bisphosphate aldolase class II
MLVDLKLILENPHKEGWAVGSFNCVNLESILGIIESAEELNTPVILGHAQPHNHIADIDVLGPIMVRHGERAGVPVCVHADHCSSFDHIKKAVEMGFTSVMYDGSMLPFEENINNTKKIVEYASKNNISVEAELGKIAGLELGSSEKADSEIILLEDQYTNPESAEIFVQKTNVDALAISFGTAHGVYISAPELDVQRIKLIKEKIDIPLVMHGGSGLSREEYHSAIKHGISKINYFTNLSLAGGEEVKKYIESVNDDIYRYDQVTKSAQRGIKNEVLKSIQIFNLKL